MKENGTVDTNSVMAPDVADEVERLVAVGSGERAERSFRAGGASGGDEDFSNVGVGAIISARVNDDDIL